MRVLVVTHGFPPAASAGAELYARAQARALHKLGDEVVVLTREEDPSRPDGDVRSTDDGGLRVVWVNNTCRRVRAFADTYLDPVIGPLADRLVDEIAPEAAHVHHLTGLSTSIVRSLAARRVPCVMTLHDYWLICHRGQLLDPEGHVCDGPEAHEPAGCPPCVGTAGGASAATFLGAAAIRAVEQVLPARPGRALHQAAARLACAIARDGVARSQAEARVRHMRTLCDDITHFLAPSQFIRERFIRFGIPTGRITWSPYGLDPTAFRHGGRRPGDRLRIGFLGTLMASKAPHLLLEAFGRLPQGRASVELFGPTADYHGDDGYRERLAPLLDHPDVHVHGPIPHERVPEALASIDVLVVPSIWPENSPFVIHEAFLAGVPIVASRIGGIPEIVDDGVNGLLFTPGDAEALAHALDRVLSDPQLLSRLRAGRPEVRDIADDVQVARRLYREHADPAPSHARLGAVVLDYRTPDDTLLAVRSLLALNTPPDGLVVVENAPAGDDSADALGRALARAPAPVTRIHTGRNLGFAGGTNTGIRHALARGAEAILLVNSDVVIRPDCVTRLRLALDSTPGAGIAGPVVLRRSEPDRIDSRGLSFAPGTGRMRVTGADEEADLTALPSARTVDAVSGCVMLVRRDVFDAVGLFDEDYFFGFEDLDFCLRARQAGFLTVLAGRAVAYHEGSRSIGRRSREQLYFAARNHLRLAAKIAPDTGAAATMLRTASIVALNLAHAVKPGGGSVGGRVAAVIRGTRDYAAGRFGAGVTDPSSIARP